ncbi:hypothetical protein [Halobacillus litoralis]|uniref:hypothetical protein n=1 Tax=Halobacillus litoralis TaxID=45668 RepID=UPI001CFE546E|nr:hypothetical protein [Halobacillus litoralis]
MLWLIYAIPAVLIAVTVFFDQKRKKERAYHTTSAFEEMYRCSSAGDKATDKRYSKNF